MANTIIDTETLVMVKELLKSTLEDFTTISGEIHHYKDEATPQQLSDLRDTDFCQRKIEDAVAVLEVWV